MIRSDKKLKKLSEIINKDNNILIIDAIRLLRNEQPFEGAIGLLITLFNKTDDHEVKKTIKGFLNDLKDQEASKEIIIEILKEWKPDTISMLVSSCWQSGLNYSDYAIDITKIFLKGDYVTAIECLTVIEEVAHDLNKEQKNEILRLISENPTVDANEKRELILELISILRR